MLKIMGLAFATVLAGCATTAPQVVKIQAAFDERAAASALNPGSNTVTGSAFLRQRGGGVVTCAGADVDLLPATPYAIERLGHIYGSGNGGLRTMAQHQKPFSFDPDPAGYRAVARKAKCDAQGHFSFDKVADGDFFVVTAVTWVLSAYSTDGGTLMQRFTVSGGETKNLVVTP